MKKNLFIISFSTLLLVSPGISSQTSDKQNIATRFTPATQNNLASETAGEMNTQNGLMLAKANILDSQNSKPLINN